MADATRWPITSAINLKNVHRNAFLVPILYQHELALFHVVYHDAIYNQLKPS